MKVILYNLHQAFRNAHQFLRRNAKFVVSPRQLPERILAQRLVFEDALVTKGFLTQQARTGLGLAGETKHLSDLLLTAFPIKVPHGILMPVGG